MDRRVTYTGSIPQDLDWLEPQRAAMVGLAGLSEAVLGRNPIVDGLTVNPTTPTSLAVSIYPGTIYAPASLDAQAYGSLPADTLHSIVKQGVQLDAVRLPITPPGTPGYSQVFLIQAAFQEVDTGAVVLPYYRSDNPSQPWAGPANSGAQQFTRRNGSVVLQVKAGAPAPTGSQPTPSADANWIGLAWVTVAAGQAVILPQHIVQNSGIRLTRKLPALGRIVGGAVTVVSGPRQLNVDDAGLVVLDVGAWSDDVTIRLPPVNFAPGEPMRFRFVGRFITPRTRNTLSWGRIVASGSDTLEAPFIFCGPNDSVDLVSDGASRWFWLQGKAGTDISANAAGDQALSNGVSSAVSFLPLNAWDLPSWFNPATPTRINFAAFGRYKITAGACFLGGNNAGFREMKVVVNGNFSGSPLPWVTVPYVPDESTLMTASSGPIGIADGSYIELYVKQTSGAPLNITGARTFLSVEVLHP